VPVLAVVAACLSLALLVLLYRSLVPASGVRGTTAIWLSLAGAAVAVPVMLLTSYVLDSLGWTTMVKTSGAVVSLAASVGIVASLEQTALVVVIWPVYRAHRLERMGTAISAGVLAAAGFGFVQSVTTMATATSAWMLARVFANFVTRVFCAGIWSSCLSISHARYRHFFPLGWLLGFILDGLLRHLVEGRGSGWLVVALPLLLAMLLGSWHVRVRLVGDRESILFVRPSRLGILVDPHGIGTMRAAWQHAHRPALLHWIVGGAFVSFGANIVGFAVGVAVARYLRIDLSRVNETDVGAMAPLAILGVAVLLSYPIAGYLTAKASAADSVFEPGVAALISITALTVLLSLTAPVTIVLGLALAPVAFGLACLGAWLGLSPTDVHAP
jgi:hypothetical protein